MDKHDVYQDAYGISMRYLWYARYDKLLWVHVVKPTFWPVEGVTTGSHHSSAPLGLSFQAFEGVQRAAISVRDHILV